MDTNGSTTTLNTDNYRDYKKNALIVEQHAEALREQDRLAREYSKEFHRKFMLEMKAEKEQQEKQNQA